MNQKYTSILSNYKLKYLKRFEERNKHLSITHERLYDVVSKSLSQLSEPISRDEFISYFNGTYKLPQKTEKINDKLKPQPCKSYISSNQNKQTSLTTEFEGHFVNGINNYHLKYYREAKKQFLLCVENNYRKVNCFKFLGMISLKEKDYTTAIKYFDKEIFLFPKNSLSYLLRATAKIYLQQYDLANIDLQKAKETYLLKDEIAGNYSKKLDGYLSTCYWIDFNKYHPIIESLYYTLSTGKYNSNWEIINGDNINENIYIINPELLKYLPEIDGSIYIKDSSKNSLLSSYVFDNYHQLNENLLDETPFNFVIPHFNKKSKILNSILENLSSIIIDEIIYDYEAALNTAFKNLIQYCDLNDTVSYAFRFRIINKNKCLVIVNELKEINNSINIEHCIKSYCEQIEESNRILHNLCDSSVKIFDSEVEYEISKIESIQETAYSYYDNNTRFSPIDDFISITKKLLEAAEDDFEKQNDDNIIEVLKNNTSKDVLKIISFLTKVTQGNPVYTDLGLKEFESKILIKKDFTIFLVDYNIELKLNPRQKTLYLLFLENPEGIILNNLEDHKDRLKELYSCIRPSASMQDVSRRINNIIDNYNFAERNKIISRIKSVVKKLMRTINPQLANAYYISGDRGYEKYLPIASNIDFVIYEK